MPRRITGFDLDIMMLSKLEAKRLEQTPPPPNHWPKGLAKTPNADVNEVLEKLRPMWDRAAGTGRSAASLSRAECASLKNPDARNLSLTLWDLVAAENRLACPGKVDTLKELTPSLKHVFGNSVTDIVTHHNQDLDALQVARQRGLLNERGALTLIHCDTHSDLYRGASFVGQNIGNYINTLVKKGDVDAVYWVVPDESRSATYLPTFWNPGDPATQRKHPDAANDTKFLSGPADQTIYVRKEHAHVSYDKPADYDRDPSAYRTVAFHKVLLGDLPSFAGRTNVWMDIDADYFANTGNDTAGLAYISYQGKAGLTKFVETLEAKGIAPCFTTCATSPGYTVDLPGREIRRLFHLICDQSACGDFLVGYKHIDPYAQTAGTQKGKNVLRNQHPLLRLLHELQENDVFARVPDGMLKLDGRTEHRAAVTLTMRTLNVGKSKAERVLTALAGLDGVTDGRINFDAFERLLSEGALTAKQLPKI